MIGVVPISQLDLKIAVRSNLFAKSSYGWNELPVTC